MDHDNQEPARKKKSIVPPPVPSSGVKNITCAKGKKGGSQPRILLQGNFLTDAGFIVGGTYSYLAEPGKITLQAE